MFTSLILSLVIGLTGAPHYHAVKPPKPVKVTITHDNQKPVTAKAAESNLAKGSYKLPKAPKPMKQ